MTIEFTKATQGSVSGDAPEFGAIFMSNRHTKHECLKKQIFGLPSFYSDFVLKVKSGMILFLFEYQQRKLYGVFQAVSDGGMNIIPDAYSSSGKQFSAQVLISSIWNCRPLNELDFRDAIRENYYSPNKFNFGLSKDQVHRLLSLFDSQKIGLENTDSQPKLASDGLCTSEHASLCLPSLEGPIDSRKASESTCCSPELLLLSDVEPARNGVEPKSFDFNSDFEDFISLPESSPEYSASNLRDFIPLQDSFPEHSDSDLGDFIPLLDSSPEHSEADLGDFIPLPDSSPEHSEPDLGDFIPLPDSSRKHSDSGTGCAEEYLEDRCAGSKKESQNHVSPPCELSNPLDCHAASFKDAQNDLKETANPQSASQDNGSAFTLKSENGEGSNHCNVVSQNHVYSKGLYSDRSDKEISVFSRLNSDIKWTGSGKLRGAELLLSVNDIMEDLQVDHCKWMKRTRLDKAFILKKNYTTPRKEVCVFQRLGAASKDASLRLGCSPIKKPFQDHGKNLIMGGEVTIRSSPSNGVWVPKERRCPKSKEWSLSSKMKQLQKRLGGRIFGCDNLHIAGQGKMDDVKRKTLQERLVDARGNGGCERWSHKEKVDQSPSLNFRRRNSMTPYKDDGTSLTNNGESDNRHKRRKLSR